MRGWHCFALTGVLALAAIPSLAVAQDNAPPAQTASAQPASSPEARGQALISFQRDLVSVLALRAEAMPLLGAALLARPLPQQSKLTRFHALITRAAAADDAGPAVEWARLSDCDAKADTCPNAVALRKLEAMAPDNAAVWLLKLGLDTRDMKSTLARADLAKAANAKRYDDYTGTSLKALTGVVGALPPPAATQSAGGVSGVQQLMAYGTAQLQPRPALPVAAELCKKADKDASIKADCLKLGELLSWGSSPLARSLGLHLIETLASDQAQQAKARSAGLDLAWQVQNFARLATRAQNDPTLAYQLLGVAQQGDTEMSQMLAALRASGVSLTAPGSWQPPAPEAASAVPGAAHSP